MNEAIFSEKIYCEVSGSFATISLSPDQKIDLKYFSCSYDVGDRNCPICNRTKGQCLQITGLLKKMQKTN